MVLLFKRSSKTIWHFFFFVVLSLSMIFLDYSRNVLTENLRNYLSIPIRPMQLLAEMPLNWIQSLKEHNTSYFLLRQENERLRHEHELLLVRFEKWRALKQENKQLHALLNTVSEIDGRVLGAKAINILSSNSSKFMLNKGRLDGVFTGQLVLDTKGVVGKVIRVDYFSSVVELIFDLKSAIPVEVVRTGEQGILVGTGSMEILQLNNLPKTSTVSVGDLLVTSSLAENFPAGYPVGTIRAKRNNSSEMFAEITVSPVAEIQKNREFFLLWPNVKQNSYVVPVLFGQ
jgi:rod shape-determining protein MreC